MLVPLKEERTMYISYTLVGTSGSQDVQALGPEGYSDRHGSYSTFISLLLDDSCPSVSLEQRMF